jgi:hypothetical protein
MIYRTWLESVYRMPLILNLTLQVKGLFLMDNQLTEVWKKLRGFDEQMVIDESFTDTISIYQAPYLGLM